MVHANCVTCSRVSELTRRGHRPVGPSWSCMACQCLYIELRLPVT
jgi:hypothetical protein